MYPDRLFEINLFGKTVGPNLYGIMIAIGILAAMAVLFIYGKKIGITEQFIDFIFYNSIAAIALGFGSAALFQAFYNYLDDPSMTYIEHLKNGGMTFIGGLIGGTIVFLAIYFILRKKLKGRLIDSLSMIPCAILVAHGFGRLGCFFVGCCYGKVTDSFLGVKFPHLAEKVHPTQLYEAAFLFIMFAICSYLLLKKKFRHNMSLYLVSYGVFRFLIEYVRGDERGELVSIVSPSQFWSIFMILIGVALFFAMEKFFPVKKEASEEVPAAESPASEEAASEADASEADANEADANEVDANEADANEVDANEVDANEEESPSAESESKE